MSPSLSVIVVTYNAEAFIADCLRSVKSQRTGATQRIVVVDNASGDATAARVREVAPEALFIPSAMNAGFAAANNTGIRRCDAGDVLLLNPDTRMHPGSLEALAGYLDDHPSTGIAGPKLLNADGSLQRTGIAFPSIWNLCADLFGLDRLFPHSRFFGRHRRLYLNPEEPAEVDFLQGSCLLMRRSVLDAVGLLDEQFFMYFEETDLCRRVRDAGWTVAYVPGAVVTHLGGSGASLYSGARLRDFHRSFLIYLRKHETPFRRSVMRLLLLLRAIGRATVLLLAGLVRPSAERRDRARGYLASAAIMVGWSR